MTVLAMLVVSCGSSDRFRQEVGPIGNDTTLTAARSQATYPIALPAFKPEGLGAIDRVWSLGAPGPELQVAVEWEDGTELAWVLQETEKDFQAIVDILGKGELVIIRDGSNGYARGPHRGEPGHLTWYESSIGVLFKLTGPHSVADLVRMAESIPS